MPRFRLTLQLCVCDIVEESRLGGTLRSRCEAVLKRPVMRNANQLNLDNTFHYERISYVRTDSSRLGGTPKGDEGKSVWHALRPWHYPHFGVRAL